MAHGAVGHKQVLKPRPKLSLSQILFMSFGFMGIQFGFALQNGNASRILENFGADIHSLSWFWIVAPLTGMIVQPIIGQMSDKTWNRYGRRKPYFLVGTLICCVALILLPNSGTWLVGKYALFMAGTFLALMDASINVAMEPFRALVADNLPNKQRTLGFSIQTFLIGLGAVAGSWMPWAMENWFGVSGQAADGQVADNVIYSFYFGAVFFLVCILVTVFFAKEYPPAEYEEYHGKPDHSSKGFSFKELVVDFKNMPKTMLQLGLVQFFSWFGLFCMWVFTTKAIAQGVWHLPVQAQAYDGQNKALFDQAGTWVGIMFAVYNGISALYALILPWLVRLIGRKSTHAFSLICGGVGLISMTMASTQYHLLIGMVGVGFAWASILAMPYAILAGSLPPGKMGIYMGIFNFFITIPQIISSIFGGFIVSELFDNSAMDIIVLGGILFLCAALSMIFVQDGKRIKIS